MKKVVRTVWISLLSGLAFLTACVSPNGLTRSERKQLRTERTELIEQIDIKANTFSDDPKILLEIREEEMKLRHRLAQINQQLGEEPMISQNIEQMSQLRSEMDSIRNVIRESNNRNRIIHEPQPCVYGPPR